MLDTSRCQDYLEKTIEFAKSVGLYEPTPEQAAKSKGDTRFLKSALDYLDNFAGKDNTVCVLSKDFSKHSFEFVIRKKDSGATWFNGGLIFHGSHDNGGDGGAPTFAVCLEPTYGWSIHT